MRKPLLMASYSGKETNSFNVEDKVKQLLIQLFFYIKNIYEASNSNVCMHIMTVCGYKTSISKIIHIDDTF